MTGKRPDFIVVEQFELKPQNLVIETHYPKLVLPRPGLSAEESAFSQQRHSRFQNCTTADFMCGFLFGAILFKL
jgi:hypothetical protein